ncbi:UDP-N-acetylmuramoyl-tripeptide--D-alanyl-D-alanine ligase [Pseudokordiimonas caeni]|uniref:UDP-N-acetylmuramoyl-tripeptide--D-alanyl-D- alanine ligase n=1 Tax=Pseudokordiimonas caeni TaxID=2997908 RepID=UPI0028117150|nr:UDP-N-acetylmuramoyl-tripeptide--D-alanyl-D-alanine ligase [Pseudokordiimonas caeni]
MTTGFIASLILFALTLSFAHLRGLALMKFFQQEEYDGRRFLGWFRHARAFDCAASLWWLAAVVIAIAGYRAPGVVLTLIGFGHGILLSRRASRDAKKALVMTERVKRIHLVYLCLAGLLAAYIGHDLSKSEDEAFLNASYEGLLLIPFVQLLPLLIVLANFLLSPFEARVKARFRAEAVEKFNRLAPKVIAITGSFGKTSTKHILHHILSAAAPTLSTPGSVNTDMGITRVIRESLTPEHGFFIVEMGAYGPGSIARLCKLTPPDVGLITAVGAAHYERFKSLETVAKAKFELAEATFRRGGPVIVNAGGIAPELLAERMQAVQGDYRLLGEGGALVLEKSEMTADGLVLSLREGEATETLTVPLWGHHQAGNVALAALTARALGLPWSAIRGALATMGQIRHRLEVTKAPGQPTIVNDAYNSNPVGFKAALETLDVLKAEGGKRILVTPGMVELGARHDEDHFELGKAAATHADIVAVVTPDRIPTFVQGLKAAGTAVEIREFAKQDEAEAYVRGIVKAGDVVLFENNLPDLYEAKVRF